MDDSDVLEDTPRILGGDTPGVHQILGLWIAIPTPLTLPVHKHLTHTHRDLLLVGQIGLGSRTSSASPWLGHEQVSNF